ncbi:diguanylate cyclase [Thermosipho africanus H17ap60334]|jgi:GGDEF domain-containing protein|uniref:Diguanylate cyclase n=1 Tax=Thermosipho africanus (strain TCF52B) TaxID=484019 RepID=B7IEA1_THEAB|nr:MULTISPECIES: diguanylate cyclase [Thermosipho]ACJ76328.1 diguanylate cyclase [Thermosipho africanus TCF52B]EKF49207.1 diguanylate cyclase [Thermosipho africanus H17ap60334]MBZ4650556.1 diguanylate cyclase [Thermosipho sp. (in: thermotogales)]
MDYLLKLLNGNFVDKVTRLPNESFFNTVYSMLSNSNSTFFVITLDLDFDSLAEDEINFVIARAASVIKHSVRIPKDFVFRSGQKRFSIILHGINEITAKQIANRIKESLDYLFLNYKDKNIKIDTKIKIEKLGGAIGE